jgi:hypothetical protein
MFSPAKKEDKQFLLEIAETVELLVRIGTPLALDVAEGYGDIYLNLEKKIQTYDYSLDDKLY